MDDRQESEVAGRTPLGDVEFREVLDAMLDNVAIGEAVRDDDGHIVDFVLVYLNVASLDGAGRSASDLIGLTVCEAFPGWEQSGQLDRFREVVETGVPYIADRLAYSDVAPDGTVITGHWTLSAVRFGDGYITASRDVTALMADEEALRSVEREAERNRLAVALLQRAALPATLPRPDGVEIAARYESAARAQPVGGDWYDAFELGDGLLGLVIADVAGHGPDAAAFMVQVRNVVRALAIEHRRPDLVLERANKVVCMLDEQQLFATCCYAVVHRREGTFTWASAGHYLPLHIGADTGYLTAAVGPPLGVQPGALYEASVVPTAVDDLFVLFTDGLVEDRARPIEECLAALARQAASQVGASAEATADALVSAATDRSDDLALICLRVTPL